jgi:hypothetical protein
VEFSVLEGFSIDDEVFLAVEVKTFDTVVDDTERFAKGVSGAVEFALKVAELSCFA